MTTTDLWITNLSGGRSLGQHGGLISSASQVAWVLRDFIDAGKASAHPDHCSITDIESTVSGDVLIDIFRETEKRTGTTLLEGDNHGSIDCVNKGDTYRIRFIEF
ncbi:hypothetical protein DVS77_18910 [Mycolicibacterium moriokaense]|nr:hypothetical protein DVS77_18910 [Mycolicibacterium moriokaense]